LKKQRITNKGKNESEMMENDKLGEKSWCEKRVPEEFKEWVIGEILPPAIGR
jgi:hypothetical protein